MGDRSTGGEFPGGASASSTWDGFQESQPQPFPHTFPDFQPQPDFYRGDQPQPFPHTFPDFQPHPVFYRDDRLIGTSNQAYLGNANAGGSGVVRNDVKSCFFVSAAFSFFVCLCMAFGLYGSETLRLGPNTSALITANHLFVESIQVVELDSVKKGPMLYGFYKTPPLDGMIAWSEAHEVTLPSDFHKEWVFHLNTGSQLSINYTVDSPSSLVLAVVEGNEGLTKWLNDPSNPDTALLWNIIYGNGIIRKDIYKSSDYYIAVGNLNTGVVKVDLNIGIKALLYNTTQPYYKCTPSDGPCNFNLFLLNGNTAVLTSPARSPEMLSGDWQVELSYGPRWVTYLIATATMISLLVIINYLLIHFQRGGTRGGTDESGDSRSERNPLIAHETDKHSSRSSSCGSISECEGNSEDEKAGATQKPVKDEEETRRLCAICFDAPKNCFFLPCGHCVSCFTCASRVLDASGSCPICRRRIKKILVIKLMVKKGGRKESAEPKEIQRVLIGEGIEISDLGLVLHFEIKKDSETKGDGYEKSPESSRQSKGDQVGVDRKKR